MHIISSEGRTAAGEKERTHWEAKRKRSYGCCHKKEKLSLSKEQEILCFCPFSGFQEQPESISFSPFTQTTLPLFTSLIHVDQELYPYSIDFQDKI